MFQSAERLITTWLKCVAATFFRQRKKTSFFSVYFLTRWSRRGHRYATKWKQKSGEEKETETKTTRKNNAMMKKKYVRWHWSWTWIHRYASMAHCAANTNHMHFANLIMSKLNFLKYFTLYCFHFFALCSAFVASGVAQLLLYSSKGEKIFSVLCTLISRTCFEKSP